MSPRLTGNSRPRRGPDLLVDAPSIHGSVRNPFSNDRMLECRQELTEVIILRYLGAVWVTVHFGSHRMGQVVGIRRAGQA